MIQIAILITVIYVFLIGAFIIGFFNLKEFKLTSKNPENSFSVLIPFRNEATNLPALLSSISELEYPFENFEIILINDDSEDNYKTIIENFKLKHTHIDLKVIDNIRKSNSPKKDAIETGIQRSKFGWVLTTDADCILPKFWILSYDAFIQANNPYLIAGPVSYKKATSFLDFFQLLDFSAMIGSTIGSFGIKKPFMCNGANLCYKKDVFFKLNGFEGNNHLASGDDVFFLEKMTTKYPTKTKYLKSINALVETTTETSMKNLLKQRIRWASKSTSYTNPFSKFVSSMVLLTNFVFLVILIYSILTNGPSLSSSILIFLKIIIDFCLIWMTLSFLNKRVYSIWYPIMALIYPFFIILTSVFALFSNKYEWKNRNFKHQ